MEKGRAFRIDVGTAAELGAFLAGFRADALRVFSRHYNHAVADETARRVDLHRVRVDVRDPASNPLHDATKILRQEFSSADLPPAHLDVDCVVQIHLVDKAILAEFRSGNAHYLRMFASRAGLLPYAWSADGPKPKGVTAKEWDERGRLWTAASASPKLGVLQFRMVDGKLPVPKWTALRRHLPDFEARVRRTARAKVFLDRTGRQAPADRNEAAEFRSWLATPEGTATYDAARKYAERALPSTFERDDFLRYGEPPKIVRRKQAKLAAGPDAPVSIDHLDVVESADGRVFVAVMDAGLSKDDRLFVQVTGRQVSFVQSGVSFGQVDDVPSAEIDRLRKVGEVTVVEIRRYGDRRELKAKHVALVRDLSTTEMFGATLSRWRNKATASIEAEKEWAK